MYMLIYAAALRTFWRISRNAKKCRGWVQILSTHQMNENLIKQKGETGRCKLAPTCLALPLYQWLRGKDLNQRPPGYEPDELPAALPRDIQFSLDIIAQLPAIVKRLFLPNPGNFFCQIREKGKNCPLPFGKRAECCFCLFRGYGLFLLHGLRIDLDEQLFHAPRVHGQHGDREVFIARPSSRQAWRSRPQSSPRKCRPARESHRCSCRRQAHIHPRRARRPPAR